MSERASLTYNPTHIERISSIRQEGVREEGPWYLLPGTGFNVALQVDRFEADINTGILQERPTQNVFEEAFQKIEQDIQGFKVEYLCEGLLFPIVLDRDIVDGKERIVPASYGARRPLTETVSQEERLGAVKKTVEDVEGFLLSAPPGSIAIMASPDNWSGFPGITYQDSQTYAWRVMEDGRPMGFTFRTDMTLTQNRQLLQSLGKNLPQADNLRDEIVNIVSTPVFIHRQKEQNPWEFEDIVNIIQDIKGSEKAYKDRPFEEIYDQLQNPDSL